MVSGISPITLHHVLSLAEPGVTHKGWWPAGPGEAPVFSGLELQGAPDDGYWVLKCAHHDCSQAPVNLSLYPLNSLFKLL